jgi:hypothetical protein
MVESSSTILYIFISITLGVVAYMLSGAVKMWLIRNKQELKQTGPVPLLWVIARFILLIVIIVAVILFVRELLPYKIYSTQGILKGEGLFPVRAIEGYQARIEAKNDSINKYEAFVTYTRKLGPNEEAEARFKLALLQDNIAEIRTNLDPNNSINQLQRLSEAERLRTAQELKEKERNRVIWDIENLKFRVDEQESNLTLAQKEMEFARDAIKTGLISKIEYDRREQNFRQQSLKLKELKTRLNFEMSKKSVQSIANNDDSRICLNDSDECLDQIVSSIVTDLSLEPSNAMLKEFERRVKELDSLLSGSDLIPIAVNAPWDGVIAYNNPSSALAPRDLIAVLAQPNSLFVEVLVPVEMFEAIDSGAEIKLTNQYYSDLGVVLLGKLQRTKAINSNQSMLVIGLEPKSDLVRDIALNKEVMLMVSFINQPPNIFKEFKTFLSKISVVNIVLIIAILLLVIMLLLRSRKSRVSLDSKTEGNA